MSRAVKGGLVVAILVGAVGLRIAEVQGTSYRPRKTPRFREPVDPFLILLAAAGFATLTARLRGAPVVGERRAAVTARPAQLVEVVERLA